jgi:hypothetical protein
MADEQQLLQQIYTSLEGTVRRLRVTIAEDDGTELFSSTDPGHVQLTGSIEEHMWVDGDAEPTPTATRAIGLVFDPGTDDVTVKVWTGAAWEVM